MAQLPFTLTKLSLRGEDGARRGTRVRKLDRLIYLLREATDTALELFEPEDNDYYKHLIDEVAETILDVGQVPLSQIAPPLKVPFQPPTDLHYKLYPETFDFRLETIHDSTFLVPTSPKEAVTVRDDTGPDPSLMTDFEPDPPLPRYSSRDIIILEEYKERFDVRKVKVGSQVMLCKSDTKGLEFSDLTQELINLQGISQAFAESGIQIRIPLVRGYATHAETGAIVGMLREWIPPGRYGNTLQQAGRYMASIPIDVRRRWLKQITDTVHALHSAGLLWGDGKVANICIDPDDNVWLVDFAGGWTQKWVNKDIAGTKHGDEHALLKLKAFLDFHYPQISAQEKRELYFDISSSSE
ncbi:hypothetical protein ACHAPJ_011534 [Fusarium lateritium]